MFHDMGKDLSAAEVLRELIDAMEKDPNLEARIESTSIRDPDAFRARMHYFYARHYRDKNDMKTHQEHLDKAIASDPKDADVLIAMFRVPKPTPEWQSNTKKLIWEAARGFHDDVDKFERVVNEQPDERQRGEVGSWLAMLCNQYAWLIANTEGDFEEARRCSHKSLELRPGEAGYMDTLARCYYAKKDFENAVKYQAMAAKKKPHSGQIHRQLEAFEKDLADSRKPAAAQESPK
jgi:tetratricopeptide (TPR) repeat protein